MSTIPASQIVSVVPSVLLAGGTGLTGTGLMLTHNARLPVGSVVSFSGPQAVSAYFGASDPLVNEANIYFDGFQGSSITPAVLLMAQFNQAAVAAFLRGGNISGLTLSQLQAITGTLFVVFDGVSRSGGTVNLSSATSFSDAATILQSDLNTSLPTEASVTASIAPETSTFTGSVSGYVMTVTTVPSNPIVAGATVTGTGVTANTVVSDQLSGTPGGIGTYALSMASIVASESITSTYGLMTVTVVGSGTLAVGQTLSGSGVTVGTLITQLGSGTGGTGTYYVNDTQTVGSEAITATATGVVVDLRFGLRRLHRHVWHRRRRLDRGLRYRLCGGWACCSRPPPARSSRKALRRRRRPRS